MPFTFFGLFADPAPGLSDRISEAWTGADVIRMEQPILAIGARFGENFYEQEREDIPEPMIRMVEGISAEYPTARFLFLRTECHGGTCGNWGQIIQNGRTVFQAEGDQALRHLIKYWGVDLGPREIFDPLRRDFPWGGREPAGSYARADTRSRETTLLRLFRFLKKGGRPGAMS